MFDIINKELFNTKNMTDTIYCTYVTYYSGNKLPPFYIGSSSVDRVNNGYHGSVTSKKYKSIYKAELSSNQQLFKTDIIKKFDNRQDALQHELELQKSNNAVRSRWFFNESLATVDGCHGRDCSGELHWTFGKSRTAETKTKISANHQNVSGEHNPMFGKIRSDSWTTLNFYKGDTLIISHRLCSDDLNKIIKRKFWNKGILTAEMFKDKRVERLRQFVGMRIDAVLATKKSGPKSKSI